MKILTRTIKLSVYGNLGKMEIARYTADRYNKYVQHFCTQLYFYPNIRLSTQGMGGLANQAQYRALGILRAHRAAIIETGNKSNIPQVKFLSCPAKIEESKESKYDYWISFENQFSKSRIRIPAKSHKRLNKFLKEGWELNSVCELVVQKNGNWQARVFVQKVKPAIKEEQKFLGIDVGITHSITRSDGYMGKNLNPIIKQNKISQAERQRQKHKKKSVKTILKQMLDVEVNRTLVRCKNDSLSLAVENPKQLANLRGHHGWARCYFANRITVRAEEEGIRIVHVNPAYTSITCSICGNIDKRNRVNRTYFKCLSCNREFHADINAARNVARKGSVISNERSSRKSGTVDGVFVFEHNAKTDTEYL